MTPFLRRPGRGKPGSLGRILVVAVAALVGLGLTLGAFHFHPDNGHCNACKDLRTATAAGVVTVIEAGLPPAVAVVLRPGPGAPAARAHARPPLRAPPSA